NPLEGFHVLELGLDPPRELLAERLNTRCRQMFEAGLIGEVQSILARGFPANSKALESIGYREAVLHLQDSLTLEEAIEQAQIATRQYAKRQRTWFRREPNFQWLQGFGNQDKTIQEAIRHASTLLKNHG